MAKYSDDENLAFKLAYKLLGLRLRSVFEMERKLEEKNFDREMVARVIKKLKKQKYLDDEKFAEAWILDRISLQPRGRFIINRELKEKKIASEIIERKMSELLPFEKELEMAERLFDKKIKIIKTGSGELLKEKIYQKMAGFLRGKGFGREIIRKILEERMKNNLN